MFLKIQNRNVSSLEAIITFGIGTARGEQDKIGQFSSGAKFGITTLLRLGMSPVIYLGNNQLEFYTEKIQISGKEFTKIGYTYQGVSKIIDGYTLEFGALDWNNINMALREFISNAIDQGEYSVSISSSREGTPDHTTIFVPLTEDVKKYYDNIHKYFLHFSQKDKDVFLEKDTPSICCVYRRGVFVRELDVKSLYDYNLYDIDIDEARNLDDYKAKSIIAKLISQSTPVCTHILRTLLNNISTFETIYEYLFSASNSWFKAWESLNAGIPCQHGCNVDKIKRKGFTPILIDTQWVRLLEKSGVTTQFQILSDLETKGHTLLIADPSTAKIIDKYWKLLAKLGFTNNKTKPGLKMFESVMDGGEILGGYYKDNTIYISLEHAQNHITILEELVHHVTGSSDQSRDMQDFLLRLAVRLTR